MFNYRILFLGIYFVSLSTAIPAVANDVNSAYILTPITEEEYLNDSSGQVYKKESADQNGNIVTEYYRYTLNNSKEYNNNLSGVEATGTGDGQIQNVPIGLGINNTETRGAINNTLFSRNSYTYDYTGDGTTVHLSGGALYNDGTIKNNSASEPAISADFIENSITANSNISKAVHVRGAAMANLGTIEDIKGDFIKNSIQGNHAEGGAVYNSDDASIKSFTGDFLNNSGIGEDSKGGAIFNLGKIGTIAGSFISNTVTANTQANGGAIHNNHNKAYISSINGTFIGNSAIIDEIPSFSNLEEPLNAEENANDGANQAWGGAIDNHEGNIGSISGYFSNNSVIAKMADSEAIGGAIVNNNGKIETINGTFVDNVAQGEFFAGGGAIYNDSYLTSISGNFVGNSASANTAAQGGAIYHDGIETEPTLKIINSNFINNQVSGRFAQGGAIYADHVNIIANGKNSLFQGNTANGKSNAIYIEPQIDYETLPEGTDPSSIRGTLDLTAQNHGKVIFNDDIDGSNYDITILGDGSGEVVFNNTVDNATNFTITQNGVAHLGTAGTINTQNYHGSKNGTLVLDVEIDKENNKINNGIIRVEEDITGHTNVVVNSINRNKLASMENAYTLFVEAPNDNMETESSFNVTRVIGSPYRWSAFRNYQGEEEGSNWYLAVTGEEYMPEIPAYVGIHSATIEQTRGLTDNINAGLRANQPRGCCDRKFRKYHNAWINVDYRNAEIDSPSEMDADIKGITAGVDLAANMRHRLGIFGSYRQGDYDFSGKGRLPSDTKSKLDIDSYLGGLYYQYNNNHWSLLASLYGGKQDINTKTNDSSVYADTSASQYGASLELGHKFYLPQAWIIEPTIGLYYTTINIDDFTDNVENTVDYDLLHYIEAELGLRFEHLFCTRGWTAKVYLKPSVIQTFASGNNVKIDSLSPVNTYKDKTLGKMEIGAKFGITPAISAYTSANYTFGSDYKSYGVDAGLTYAW